ncbi:hypothetical protein [Novilysobacter selenitireducens]|uniref:Uncharacterized protein n=1 Tax=Novilysobacter selenitireducens TaxID=2872639 RepID=A0ABS7T9C2_9GAMM|nr:hypothetical protein [Lysobacter selenitireducens]MBZ4040441.1 hypothetical protein [Lysobacter selenitireducens]
MQFRLIPALLLFLGSYFPLALILALQDVTEESWQAGLCVSIKSCVLPEFSHPALSLLAVLISGACLMSTLIVIETLRYKYPVDVIEAKPIPSELISYSFPYIISFMGVDYASIGKVAGLTTFLIWLFLITYRAGQIIMNPILLIFGWSLYEAKVKINGHDRITRVLSKTHLAPGRYRCQEVQGSYLTKGELD